jgi:hypothetical protein
MPEASDEIEQMTNDEMDQALEEAVDGSGNTEVTGFAPRDS